MSSSRERILLVENDPVISNQIVRQTLLPLGYSVEVVKSAATAIQDITRLFPDLVIADLKLPGLSGKDLLVALAAQGLEIPVIVLSERGAENEVIQAFRLGAVDYLIWPARETEIVAAVERILKQVRGRRERDLLARELNQTNQELQRRVRELTTLFAVGKAVTSITDQTSLLSNILSGAMYTAEADCGWLLLREGNQKTFVLGAQSNLPDVIASRLGQPWEDGISSLVAVSGEPLSIHGEPLKRFKVSRLGQSALVMPVKVKNEVVGLLTLIRKAPRPFGPNVQALLGALTDYASISIVNARLFRAVEERAQSLQSAVERAQFSEQQKDETLLHIRQELQPALAGARETILTLLGEAACLNPAQKNSLNSVEESLRRLILVLDTLTAKTGRS